MNSFTNEEFEVSEILVDLKFSIMEHEAPFILLGMKYSF